MDKPRSGDTTRDVRIPQDSIKVRSLSRLFPHLALADDPSSSVVIVLRSCRQIRNLEDSSSSTAVLLLSILALLLALWLPCLSSNSTTIVETLAQRSARSLVMMSLVVLLLTGKSTNVYFQLTPPSKYLSLIHI